MKIETILNAALKAHETCGFLHWDISDEFSIKRYCQLSTFRSRIIRMDERNKMGVVDLEGQLKDCESELLIAEEFESGIFYNDN